MSGFVSYYHIKLLASIRFVLLIIESFYILFYFLIFNFYLFIEFNY